MATVQGWSPSSSKKTSYPGYRAPYTYKSYKKKPYKKQTSFKPGSQWTKPKRKAPVKKAYKQPTQYYGKTSKASQTAAKARIAGKAADARMAAQRAQKAKATSAAGRARLAAKRVPRVVKSRYTGSAGRSGSGSGTSPTVTKTTAVGGPTPTVAKTTTTSGTTKSVGAQSKTTSGQGRSTSAQRSKTRRGDPRASGSFTPDMIRRAARNRYKNRS